MRATPCPSPISLPTPFPWPSPSQGAPRLSLSLCTQPFPMSLDETEPLWGFCVSVRREGPRPQNPWLKSHPRGWTAILAFGEETEIVRNNKLFLKKNLENLGLSPVLPHICMFTWSVPSISLPVGKESILLPAQGLSSLPCPQHPPRKGYLLLWQKNCHVTKVTS